LDFPEDSFDMVTTFDSMEHWHHSPKRLFHMLKKALTPGVVLIIGVPNCSNLRKRVTTLLGRGYWSEIQHWYELDVFRAHVREPSVADLRYICSDLDMAVLEVSGRNGWAGYRTLCLPN
jgi:SAM-dependent methyltransferase